MSRLEQNEQKTEKNQPHIIVFLFFFYISLVFNQHQYIWHACYSTVTEIRLYYCLNLNLIIDHVLVVDTSADKDFSKCLSVTFFG